MASGIATFSTDPAVYLLSLIGAIFLCLTRDGGKNVKIHLLSLGLFAVMALINPIVSHDGVTVLFFSGNNPVTLEAIIYGVCAALMIISVVYWFRSFSSIMTSDKLLYLFGALSPRLALVLSMSLRYLPLFRRQAKKVGAAQKALGLYREDNVIDDAKGKLRIFSVMLTWALENGIITADSMTARGYGIGRRSHFSPFRFTRQDVFLLATSTALFAITVFCLKDTTFTYYPAISASPLSAAAAVGYIAYGILILLPTLIEIKEASKWKYLKSKI